MQSDFEEPSGATWGRNRKVAWVHPKDIPELLKNSYENIKLLFEEETVTSLNYNLGSASIPKRGY
jgi:hypothetical protein